MNKEQGTMTKKTDAPLPANVFEEDAAKGLGNIGQQDLALPFLKILLLHVICTSRCSNDSNIFCLSSVIILS